ncbi:unnamed protein product [Acanthosepion pharaonis]|uniref:Uncharacterized protein n=1 Tax=Acanthosepion pharaonis TaxID=158019 RepID=A0A812EIX9_ACAPH|nr:unnamed protein product [Sepia pharaonis]
MGSSSSYSPLTSGYFRRRHCCHCSKRCRSTCGVIAFLSAVAISLTFAIVFIYIFMTYPSHASCAIEWTFKSNCTSIGNKIEHQFEKWSTNVCKEGKMKCMYKLTYFNESLIEGTHTTPKMHFVDSLNFHLNKINDTCYVKGFSSSDLWFALLDFGTNYCNLHNLITGSGLDKMAGYSESTANAVCTLYTSSNCDVY